MPQLNDIGQVALKYYQPVPVIVQRTPSGAEYVFVVTANISLAWINSEDQADVLGRYKVCCGGNKRKSFSEANEQDVRIWTNGGGR